MIWYQISICINMIKLIVLNYVDIWSKLNIFFKFWIITLNIYKLVVLTSVLSLRIRYEKLVSCWEIFLFTKKIKGSVSVDGTKQEGYILILGAVSDLTAIKLSSSSIVFNRRIFLILRLLRYPNQVIQDCWFVSELNYFWKISWTNRFK